MDSGLNHREKRRAGKLGLARGFTLIELLVVVSVIGLLIGIVLPVLGRSKAAARQMVCQSNQRQMMVTWTTAMYENDGRISYINMFPRPNMPQREMWWGLMAEYYAGAEPLLLDRGFDPLLPTACPEIESQFAQASFYGAIYFGYSVNARWSDCGSNPMSQRRRWDAIGSPSRYPWFADPELISASTTHVSRAHFGLMGTVGPGLGYYHSGETSNAVFADGHAETFTASVLDETKPCGTPTWLLADKH